MYIILLLFFISCVVSGCVTAIWPIFIDRVVLFLCLIPALSYTHIHTHARTRSISFCFHIHSRLHFLYHTHFTLPIFLTNLEFDCLIFGYSFLFIYLFISYYILLHIPKTLFDFEMHFSCNNLN